MWLSTEFARTRTHGPSFCPATLAGMAKDAVVTRSVRMECVNANTIISCRMDIAGILVGKILRSQKRGNSSASHSSQIQYVSGAGLRFSSKIEARPFATSCNEDTCHLPDCFCSQTGEIFLPKEPFVDTLFIQGKHRLEDCRRRKLLSSSFLPSMMQLTQRHSQTIFTYSSRPNTS